jgi:transcriptional regulator with XRE-family HTH domain
MGLDVKFQIGKLRLMTLDEWRQDKNWTFEQLGKALDCSRATAFRLCRRGNLPAREMMRRIERLTRRTVDANSFYAGKPSPEAVA